MTTTYEITLEMMRHVADVLHGQATDGSKAYLKDSRRLTQANEHWDGGTVWIKNGTHAGKMLRVGGHAAQKLTFEELLSSVLCVQQVETGTVVGTVTGSGNATVIVTAEAMANSPKTVSVAVTNGDSASAVGGKIRTALAADADVKAFFDVSGSGADVVLTTKIARGNDTTINISIANGTCTGLTSAPTSTNTTAGVAGPRYAVCNGAFPMEQMIACIQSALDETWVTGEDTSLTGDGETLRFTLPAGVTDVAEIWFERPSTQGMMGILSHWDLDHTTGEIAFEFGFAPKADDVLHLYYRKPHDEIVDYETTVNPEIDRHWLTMAAARELLFWARGIYGEKPSLMIEDRLNKVMGMLKGKFPRRPFVSVKGAGGGRAY